MGVAAAPVLATAKAPATAARPVTVTRSPGPRLVQRSCDCGEAAGLSGRCETCQHTMLRPQRSETTSAAEHDIAPDVVHDALRMPGEPLPPLTRAAMELQLGHDLSQVRIHTGAAADRSARAVGANAYTVGQAVVFRTGKYRPGTPEGDRLLTHELTHTAQQIHARPAPVLRIGAVHDAHEREADAASAAPVPTPMAAAVPAPPVPAAAPVAHAPAVAPAAPAVGLQRQLVQRQEAGSPAGTPAPAPAPASSPGLVDSLLGASAAVLWGLVRQVAPAALVDMIQAVRSKGILGYLHDKLTGVFGRLFGGLNQGDAGFVTRLVATFVSLMGAVRTILGALARNDCKPLFDAVGKLGDALGQMAGEAWDRLKAFLAPVGDFFSGLWTRFGAPAVDFLSGVAGDLWNEIQSLAAQLWDAAGKLVAPAWNWLKAQLGIGDDAGGQNGLLQWVKGKLSEAWDGIKSLLEPVIAPIKAFGAKIAAVLPIDAILNLRERVHEWLQHAGSMVTSLELPNGVTEDRASLREKILPAVKAAIVSLGGKISDAGGWVANQIGGLVQLASEMLASLKSNSVLGAVSGAIDWVGDKIHALGDWVQDKVHGLFDLAGQAVAKLSGFVEPLLGVLQKLAGVIGNVVKALPDLVLGPAWALIPACIKDPIKDFVIKNILSEIPIISTFVKLPDIWAKIQKLVLDFLATVFVKGDLGGAALMVIRFVLEAAGVDVALFLRVLGRVFSVLDDIMMHPLNFLKNIGAAVIAGFRRFWDNIKLNMVHVLQTWLLAPLAKYGVTPLADLSLGSIFKLVLQVLGITAQRIRGKLSAALGPKVTGVLETAWNWISTLFTKGPAALWEEVKADLADLSAIVVGGITNWISTDLVEAGIKKLSKLSNPVGEVIEAIQTVSTFIDFIVNKMNTILAMVDSVLSSLAAIVAGQIGAAAEAIEKALVGAIANVLSFLADWTDTKVGERVLGIIEKIQMRVDKALDALVAKAISIVQKLTGTGKKDEDPKWTIAVAGLTAEVERLSKEEGTEGTDADPAVIQSHISGWKTQYGFTELTLTQTEDSFEIDGAMSPKQKVLAGGKPGTRTNPFGLVWPKPRTSDYPAIYLGGEISAHKSQSALKGLYSKGFNDETGTPVKEYAPTRPRTLPGGEEIGISQENRITTGTVVGPLSDETTPGGGVLWTVLNKYGFYASDEGTDGDHVRDTQFGGENTLPNLWPLDSATNQRAGSILGGASVVYPKTGDAVKLSTLKGHKRKYFFKVTDFS
jgi:hypothetical protein